MMKGRGARCGLLFAIVALAEWAGGIRPRQPVQETMQVFQGDLTDSYCAKSGSDREVILHMTMAKNRRQSCMVNCIKSGATVVLYDRATHRIYRLANQATVLPFLGQKVRITGTRRKNEITVAAIENIN